MEVFSGANLFSFIPEDDDRNFSNRTFADDDSSVAAAIMDSLF
jgi:hypothetical protein